MRKFTLIVLSTLVGFCTYAQSVVITAPASLNRAWAFDAAAFGAALTDTIWKADLILMDDGVSAIPSEGCAQTTNDYTGKIVMIDRGSCQFGDKCLFAENVGAIGVIMVNNVPGGPIVMGAGVMGGSVTIPCVMISLEDGNIIKPVLANETVSVCMGNIAFGNNLATDNEGISVPSYGTIANSQMNAEDDYFLIGGAVVTNIGELAAPNVTVSSTIDFTPTGGAASEVYNESGTIASVDPDSAEFVQLPLYNISDPATGIYDIEYTISSDSTDESPFDNVISSSFSVTDNIHSRASWDYTNNQPNLASAFTVGGGGTVEFLAGYKFPNGEGHRLDSIIFYVSTSEPTLEGLSVQLNLYEWLDNGNDVVENGELVLVGINSTNYPGFTEDFDWTTMPILDALTGEEGFKIPSDTTRLFVGQRFTQPSDITENILVFFGFDSNYEQRQIITNNFFRDEAELPYFVTSDLLNELPDVSTAGIFTNVGSPLATALYLSEVDVATEDFPKLDANVSLFPNPSSDYITVSLELPEVAKEITYTVRDANGRSLFNTEVNNVDNHNARFNLSNLAAGMYHMTIQTENGILTETFSVVK